MSMNSLDKKSKIRDYLLLHFAFFVYSMAAVVSKMASSRDFLSIDFLILWCASVLILFIYAILWQRLLGIFTLVTAFSYRGVVVVWGLIWGFFLFHETISITKVIAAVFIIIGITIMGRGRKI